MEKGGGASLDWPLTDLSLCHPATPAAPRAAAGRELPAGCDAWWRCMPGTPGTPCRPSAVQQKYTTHTSHFLHLAHMASRNLVGRTKLKMLSLIKSTILPITEIISSLKLFTALDSINENCPYSLLSVNFDYYRSKEKLLWHPLEKKKCDRKSSWWNFLGQVDFKRC